MNKKEASSRSTERSEAATIAKPVAPRVRLTLPISGLPCGGGGVLDIEQALQALTGVIRAYANPATEMVYVEYRPAEVTPDQLAAAIESLGYGTIRPRREPTEKEIS